MVCMFIGHREIFMGGISQKLDALLERLIRQMGKLTFLVGEHGEFDSMSASAVRKAKAAHPDMQIELILVLPYMTNRLNEEKACYMSLYDNVIVPAELAAVHPKGAIMMRNRWMVDRAELVVACVQRDFGGACQALRYAERTGKEIVNLAEGK